MSSDPASTVKLEQHTIFQVPLNERYGKGIHLLTLWFGANLNILTVVTGALATTVFGQPFLYALLAILVGNLVGAVFMALHAAQGPQLGVPQMVQSRGQFGSMGASFVVAIVVLMYIGYYASLMLIGGQSLHAVLPNLDLRSEIFVIGFVGLLGTVYGHNLIHFYTRMMTYVSGAAFAFCFLWIAFIHGVPSNFFALGNGSAVGFMGMVSISALWQISYAPYVSDYSRYLPPGTGPREAFWASYAGTVAGASVPMILGAIVGMFAASGDVIGTLASLVGPASRVVIPLFALAIAAGSGMNLYCGTLSTITLGQTLLPAWHASSRARIIVAMVLFAASLAIGILGKDNFVEYYTNFIELLLYVMVPWTAINLVDYYLVKAGDYDVASFFEADGGVYGKYNWPALACYALGILVQAPFMSSHLYIGPAAKAMGGVDISWIVGLAVISPIYYWTMMRAHGSSTEITEIPRLMAIQSSVGQR